MGYTRVYTEQNVFEAALDRVRWVFDTFKHVVVSFSGGKDSTCCLNLALMVAEEKKKPVHVMFIDQEAEWQATIDYVKEVMYDPRVRPAWLQVPFRIFNATSPDDEWLNTFDPAKKDEWCHPQDPIALKRNVYGTDRFKPLFAAWCAYHFGTQSVASLAGIRCEESPARTLGLTSRQVGQKWHNMPVTWGWPNNMMKKHYVMCPLYDWTYRDVWKAIHDNGWRYNKVYDYQYQYGLRIRDMRVSNLHHEMAVYTLWYLQEVEPETWERVQKRLAGINMATHLRRFNAPLELPYMFHSWVEYRDHLMEGLIPEKHHQYFRTMFARFERIYADSAPQLLREMHQAQIAAILVNDRFGAVMNQWASVMKNRPPRALAAMAAERAKLEAAHALVDIDDPTIVVDPEAVKEAEALAEEAMPF